MPEIMYGGKEVYEILVAYGSLIKSVGNLGDGLSGNGPNQFTRDEIARHIFYELIPKYKELIPEEIRSQLPIDIKNLEEKCKGAIIPKHFETIT